MPNPLTLPVARICDANGNPISGAKLYAYLTNTSTPAPTYTTDALDTEHTNPVVANSAGFLPAIYPDPAITYRFKAKTSAGADIDGMDFDPVSIASSGDVQFTASGTGAVVRTAQDKMRETVSLFDRIPPDYQAAIAAHTSTQDVTSYVQTAFTEWATRGGELVIPHGLYKLTSTVSVTLTAGKTYELIGLGKSLFSYAGSATTYLVQIVGDDLTPLEIDGDITFDAGSLCNKAIQVDYENVSGSNRADIRVSGVTGRNAKMTNVGGEQASGIEITGGFDRLLVERCRAINITRSAGAGTAGSQGSVGISIATSLTGTNNFNHIVVRDCVVDGVTSEEIAGTEAYVDMDGLLIFQGDENGILPAVEATAPIVERCKFYECAGRAIKMYTELGGGVVRDCEIFRSVEGKYGTAPATGVAGTGGGIDIAFQHGDGLVENCTFHYSGDAHDSPGGTWPISFANSVARTGTSYPMHSAIVRNITIADTTGVAKRALVDFYDNTAGNTYRHCKVDGVRDAGTSATLIRLGDLGGSADTDIELFNVECSITNALTRTDGNLSYLRVNASRVRNRNGTTRPLAWSLAGAERTTNLGQWKGDGTVTGFHRYTGLHASNANFHYGFYGPGGGVEADPPYREDSWTGPIRYPRQEIADGVTQNIPSTGLAPTVGGDFTFYLKRHDQTGVAAIYTTAAASTNFTSVQAGAGITVTNGGSSAGGSIFEVWKDSTTQELRIRNGTGADVAYSLTLNPQG